MWQLLLLPACLAVSVPPSPRNSTVDPEERFLNVRLNHFLAIDTTTFPMRYFFSKEFQGNDIVILVGGESEASPSMITGGLSYDLARGLNAGLFLTEHRYYGLSRPTETTSTSNLRHLTVDQVLGDLAQFIEYVKSEEFEGGQYISGKVTLIGCSYSASLATWMRLGYPHLVDAVYADSAPMEAKQEVPEFLEAVTQAIRLQGGQECVDNLEAAMEALVVLMASTNGLAQVSNMFSTCAPLQNSPLDITTFYWYGIVEKIADIALNSGDFDSLCAALTDSNVGNPVQRLATWTTSNSESCIEASYSEFLAQRTNTSYNSAWNNERLWTYQTCVQFGWHPTTLGSGHVFQNILQIEYYQQICKDLFNNVITEYEMQAGVHRTNTLFGGLSYLPDRVVSIKGARDPWGTLAANNSLSRSLAPVYTIEDGGRCSAMGSLSDEDSELESKKLQAFSDVYLFMTGRPYFESSATKLTAPLLVFLLTIVKFM